VTRQSGAARIFYYNWPVYAGTWTVGLLVVALLGLLPRHLATVGALGVGVSVAWSFASLLVSCYVYDRSGLAGGRWIQPLLDSRRKPGPPSMPGSMPRSNWMESCRGGAWRGSTFSIRGS
jgi:hypothetical protein